MECKITSHNNQEFKFQEELHVQCNSLKEGGQGLTQPINEPHHSQGPCRLLVQEPGQARNRILEIQVSMKTFSILVWQSIK